MTTMPGTRLSNGWPLVGWAAVVLGAMVAAALRARGWTLEGFGLVIGLTAITSTLLFLGAFTATAAHALVPSALTRWQLRNRRYLGVSFVVSHTYHLCAIVLHRRLSDEPVGVTVLVLATPAFVFMYAMAATSFDRTAAWLGPRWWKRLHTAGLYYIWLIFTVTYLGDGHPGPRQLFFLALLLGGLALRIIARYKTRRATP